MAAALSSKGVQHWSGLVMRTLHDRAVCMGLVRCGGRVTLLSPHQTEFRGVHWILVDTQLIQAQGKP